MTLIGFKRMTIGVHGEDGLVTDKFVVEGKTGEGATVSAEIEGLDSEAVKVYGSNIPYYVLKKGTGDVSVNLGLLDLLETVNDKILGYKLDDVNGFAFIGEDTEPPYCSIMLESETMDGKRAMLGLLKGKFGRGGYAMNTTEGENPEPDADEYTFSCIASDREGDSNGQTVVKYMGGDKEDEFEELVLPELLP
ncbi:MAG: phage tail protein [Pisciglobus halotolerans]|nr:phage tail protein [Pisciglobus halotolerans]